MKNILLILTLVWFGFIANSFSADLDKGFHAYEAEDYVTALKEWRPLAEQGDVVAQYNLGRMYDYREDYKEAVKWYRLAAEQGNAEAQNNLGLMYDLGLGVIVDKVIAYMWYNSAASQEHYAEYAKENKDMLAKQMTASQIEEAQRLARQCVKNNYKGC